ncbi:DUF302 domain-containing protein [Hwanghaeella grinnelliae]|uniref:DUF302 domain-containing protein n=1 Tax=Hwanghaeella grinnelliae TaxID=2500179 RepID=A0A437QTT4_9PROT|nr:DUF302 domain-containing protein [Hwanghaeella grinnelliae]RVU37908.1 DUF302 domain-containing protein [Hwanghaeella grinnelliae]
MVRWNGLAGLLIAFWVGFGPHVAFAAPDGLQVLTSPYGFKELEERLGKAITDHGMLRVFKASASAAANRRGVDLPGDSVFGIYRNDFAVRMIEASQLAGTEAPILIHVMEQPDGTAALAYKTPSSVFAPYADGGTALTALARELDTIFYAIARQAVAP